MDRPEFSYKHLLMQPSAPITGFDGFVVGELQRSMDSLTALVQRMVGDEKHPSCCRLILGPNGNGKTILHNAVRERASEINIGDGSLSEASFDILFSRISISPSGSEDIGLELARNLQRSYLEAPTVTYGSISLEIFRRFQIDYRAPFLLKLPTIPARIVLKSTIENNYKKVFGNGTGGEDIVIRSMDKALERIQSRIEFFSLVKAFERYCRRQKVSSYLNLFLQPNRRRGFQGVERTNEQLHINLKKDFERSQPYRVIEALGSIARSVGCKLLILGIDDCNVDSAVDFLISIQEHLGDFRQPRVLVVASAIEDRWQQLMGRRLPDRSAEEKVSLFCENIVVSPPVDEDVSDLVKKLEKLVRTHLAREGRDLNLSAEKREEIFREASRRSFRHATVDILRAIEASLP